MFTSRARRRRRGRMKRASLLVALLGMAPAFAAPPPADVPVRVDAAAVADLPGWCRDDLAHELAVAITRAPCAVRGAAEGESADIILSVTLTSWREQEESTAPSSFDPTSEPQRAGLLCRALTRRRIEIRRAGVEKPLLTNEKNFSGRSTARPVDDRDPRETARREALSAVSQDAMKLLCKEVKDLLRARARASGSSR